MGAKPFRIGVISDTHGLIRPEALSVLSGSNLIIHGGDVGSADVLDALGEIAPTHAVRGNVDTDTWGRTLPITQVVTVGDRLLYVLHQRDHLSLNPVVAGFSAVIFGHSHRASAEFTREVLYLNPGAAGPRRFSLPVSVARIEIQGAEFTWEIVELDI